MSPENKSNKNHPGLLSVPTVQTSQIQTNNNKLKSESVLSPNRLLDYIPVPKVNIHNHHREISYFSHWNQKLPLTYKNNFADSNGFKVVKQIQNSGNTKTSNVNEIHHNQPLFPYFIRTFCVSHSSLFTQSSHMPDLRKGKED